MAHPWWTFTDAGYTAYDAIFFAGGHGSMWDFSDNGALTALAPNSYERGPETVVEALAER